MAMVKSSLDIRNLRLWLKTPTTVVTTMTKKMSEDNSGMVHYKSMTLCPNH